MIKNEEKYNQVLVAIKYLHNSIKTMDKSWTKSSKILEGTADLNKEKIRYEHERDLASRAVAKLEENCKKYKEDNPS